MAISYVSSKVSFCSVNSWMWIYFHIFLVIWTSCYTSVTGQHQVRGSSQAVLAKVGDDVILPCYIEPPVDISDGKRSVVWTRPDLTPDYVHVFQNGRDVSDSKNDLYKQRTSLFAEELRHGNISLKLSRVQFSDEGTFQCLVPRLTSSISIQLRVGAVSQPEISVNGVSLTCDSGCWYPEPEVSWLDSEGNNLTVESSVTDRSKQQCSSVRSSVMLMLMLPGNVTCRIHRPHIKYTVDVHKLISEDMIPTERISTGAVIAGIIIVIIILVAAGLGYFYWKKKHDMKQPNNAERTPLNPADQPITFSNLIKNDEEIRIVMVGKTGAGKSATGNTILGREAFQSKDSFGSVTLGCTKASGSGRKVSVIDTPGFFDTEYSNTETVKEIRKCITCAAPGPHVFLAVIRIGRYTKEEKNVVENIQREFGQTSDKYTMILFTYGDGLTGPIEELFDESPQGRELKELIRKCSGFYHVLNNKNKDPSQVTELLMKINQMVETNGGSHYTNQMFQEEVRKHENHLLVPVSSTQPTATSDDPDQINIDILKEVKVHAEQYELKSEPTGLCLIMCNDKVPSEPVMDGADMEIDQVARTFSSLGFRVLRCRNQTKRQMKNILKYVSLKVPTLQETVQEWSREDSDFTDLHVEETPLQHGDAFVCCFICRGLGCIQGADGDPLLINDIITFFNRENCPDLEYKPKVFFINSDGWPRLVDGPNKNEEDFLVTTATRKGLPSYRTGRDGSLFMESVCKQLEGSPRGDDFQIIFNRVIKEVSERTADDVRGQQIPDVAMDTLNKKLVFSPI